MGTKGKRRSKEGPSSSQGAAPERARAVNPTWSDCTPAFRAEAEGVLRQHDEFAKAADEALRNQAADRLHRLGDSISRKYTKSPLAHHLAGQSKSILGKHDQALRHYLSASELQPNCPGIAHSVAAAHVALQQFGSAANECKRALAVQDPVDPLLHSVIEAPSYAPESDLGDAAAVRVALAKERLRGLLAHVSVLPPCSREDVHALWRGMTTDQRQDFLRINTTEMMQHFRDSLEAVDQRHVHSLEAALDFVMSAQEFSYWVCPVCKDVCSTSDILWSHINSSHVNVFPESFKPIQEGPDDELAGTDNLDHAVNISLAKDHLSLCFREKTLGDNGDNADESIDSLFDWLSQSHPENSWSNLMRTCVSDGANAIEEIQKLVPAGEDDIQATRSTNLKRKLLDVCKFDYRSVIIPPLKLYINAKINLMAAKLSEESKTDLGDGVKQDKVPPIPEQVQTSNQPKKTLRDTYAAKVMSKKSQDDDKKVQEKFLEFLKKFQRAEREEPFYPGELKSMISRNGTTFSVYYTDVARYDEELSDKLHRLYGRIKPLLQKALVKFIVDKELAEKCKEISPDPPELVIDGLPPPDSKQELADFLSIAANKLTMMVHIYETLPELVLDTTQLGRDLFLGFLRYVMKKHLEGKSWNGDFCIDDLRVTDGCIFEISAQNLERANRESMANDLKQLAAILLGYYKVSGNLPAYFTQLESDLNRSSEFLGRYDSDETIGFYKYLESHPALKSAMARGHLFLDLYRVRQALSKDDRAALQTVLKSVSLTFDWTVETEKHPVLKDVFDNGCDETGNSIGKNKGKKKSTSKNKSGDKLDYKNNLDDLLLFIRHVAQHGPDHSKDDNQQQKLKYLIATDLVIGKYLARAVLELIQTLQRNYQMKDDMFEHAWTHFSDPR